MTHLVTILRSGAAAQSRQHPPGLYGKGSGRQCNTRNASDHKAEGAEKVQVVH